MSDARWERIKAVFEAALAAPAQDRPAILDRECGGDAEVRREVESLLNARTQAFVRTAGAAHAMADATTVGTSQEQAGEQIGRYKLLQPIGEGGFGSVWMAEQREPVKRRVALKIIKLGMDTKQVIARFEAERQALAMMDHPNIAKVFDAGATESGRPYFVMEYIKGVPICEYCDTGNLDTKARLELFSQVCHAIQHAHMKGIIHRDIKPSNVLVTMHDGVPVPKVIDFGIAKATSAELTTRTLFTEHRQMIGTPAYMSPEQAEMSGLDIDTRSDIYSLGVLLYELLTGTTPFDSKSLLEAGFAEMMRIIREVEPPTPSTRLSSLGDTGTRTAEQRHVGDTRKLGLLLRGDLDWIVMKCLEKDRTRRYETANGLAADIKRHLNDETVTAGAPSAGYRFKKFVKRNRGQVIAGGIVAGALVLGVIGTSGGMVWALNEKTKATRAAESEAAAKVAAQANEQKAIASTKAAEAAKEEEAKARKRAETISEFVTTALQASDAQNSGKAGKTKDAAHDMTVLAAMDNAVKDIDSGRFKDDPKTEAQLRETIGIIYRNNGKLGKAALLLEQALEIGERLSKADSPMVASRLSILGDIHRMQGQYAKAEPLLSRALAIREKTFDPDHTKVAKYLNLLARLYLDQGQDTKAEPLFTRSLAIYEKAYGPEDRWLTTSLGGLGEIYLSQGKYAEAEPLFTRALAINEKAVGPDHPSVASGLNNLAAVYQGQRKYDQAEPLYTRALAIFEKAYGPDHAEVARGLNNLATVYFRQKKYSQAEALVSRSLAISEKALGPDHPTVATTLFNLAMFYYEQGEYTQAEPLFTRALAIQEKALEPNHPDVANILNGLARLYYKQGQYAQAEPLFTRALAIYEKAFDRDNIAVLEAKSNLAAVYRSQGKFDKLVPLIEEVLKSQEATLGRQHPNTLMTVGNLGVSYLEAGRIAEAIPLLEEGNRASKKYPGMFFDGSLLAAYATAGETAKAVALMQELLAAARAKLPKDSPELAGQLATSGLSLLTLKAWDEAEPLIREALTIRETKEPEDWRTFNTKSMLGGALLGQKKLAEAEPLLLAGYQGIKDREAAIPAAGKLRIPESLERLVRLYEAKGNEPEAAAWRSKLEAAKAEQAKPYGK